MDANETNEEFPTAKFQSILQVDVPKGRDGKHKKIVQELIEGIESCNMERP
jgi:hypothetical protein